MVILLLTSSALVIILVIVVVVLVTLVAFIVAAILVVWVACIGIVVTAVKIRKLSLCSGFPTRLTRRRSNHLLHVAGDGRNHSDRCSLVDAHLDSRHRLDAVGGRSHHHTGLADGPT